MSSVTELYTSRLGGVRGQHGAQGLTSTWHVVVDNVLDDPVTVLSLHTDGVTLGSVYPWLSFGVVAIGFSVSERWSSVSWLIDVLYGVPLVFAAPTGANQTWQWEGGGALEQEEYLEDAQIPPVLVGTPAYATELLEGESFTHRSTDSSGRHIDLLQIHHSLAPPRVTPLTRHKRVGWLRATKVVQQVSATQLAAGYQSISRLNSGTFFGAAENEVMVTGFGFRGVRSSAESASLSAWEISFDFSINNNKWTDVQHDTFISDGTESYIFDSDNKPVTREYFPYGKVVIDAVMSGF